MIYLDNSATTKPYNEVVEAYTKVATTYFGNPSSLHTLGMQAEGLIKQARNQIANLIGVRANEIVFTSGGTEGNNIAIKGAAYAREKRGKHLITSVGEHASVYETFTQLEKEGYEVTYLPIDKEGRVSVVDVINAIRPDTTLVSLIHVNNETGSIQPISEIGSELKKHSNIYFHVDHVQGITKVPLNIQVAGIDLMTCSAHKFHGMKGSGFLYVHEGVQLQALMHGGDQEQKLKAGTENVAGIIAMAKALRLTFEAKEKHAAELVSNKMSCIEELKKIKGVILNSPLEQSAPHIINFSVPGIKPEVLIQSLSAKEIYVSSKSACSSKLAAPSRVLTAMNIGEERAKTGVRISLSYLTTKREIEALTKELQSIIPELLEVVS